MGLTYPKTYLQNMFYIVLNYMFLFGYTFIYHFHFAR